jgi:DNA-binding transcriptional ArsR family regulator
MKERELERVLKALANRRRLAILSFLAKKKQGNVGEIAEAIKLSFKSTSRHLAILFSAGILDKEQTKLFVTYRLAPNQEGLTKKILQSL